MTTLTPQSAGTQMTTIVLTERWLNNYAQVVYCFNNHSAASEPQALIAMDALHLLLFRMSGDLGSYFGESVLLTKPHLSSAITMLTSLIDGWRQTWGNDDAGESFRSYRIGLLGHLAVLCKGLQERVSELRAMLETERVVNGCDGAMSSAELFTFYHQSFMKMIKSSQFMMVNGIWCEIMDVEVNPNNPYHVKITVKQGRLSKQVLANTSETEFYAPRFMS